MFSFERYISLIVVLNYLELIQCLDQMPPIIEVNVILTSEAIIRHTFNSLFYILKLKHFKEHTRFKEYSTIHNHFTSIALQDFDTLNQIARVARVNHKNKNNNEDFMGIMNSSFSLQNNKNDVIDNDENVTTYILYFLKILRKLKETHIVDKEYRYINRNILKMFIKNRDKSNDFSKLYKTDDNGTLNENEFWEPSARRIYKGERTKIKHYPFMASIQIFNNFHCAGSIVKSDLIITASSCLQLAWNNRLFRENPAFLSARVGSSFYSGGGEVIPILEIYFHPGYNPKNLRNNICVLRLIRHLNFKKSRNSVKKIDFDRQPSSLPVTTPGITILGWGAKEHSPVIGNPWKNILSFSVLHIYPFKDCQDVYSREYVTMKNFCAGFFSRGGGACNHDVGGPGIADGKLMGVISFGSPVCGTPDAPTVFTKLGYYSDWVEEIMEMEVPVSKKRTTLKPPHHPIIAPPLYTTTKTTSFKIPPLTDGKMTPTPIKIMDNQLRIFDDNVFKDFLATIFYSSELTENKDAPKELNNKGSVEFESTVNYDTKHHEEITEKSKQVTEIEEFLSEDNDMSYKDTVVTLNNEEKHPIVTNFDEAIEKMMENINLEKIVKEEAKVTPVAVIDIPDAGSLNTSDSHKSNNESVLTLLYLSDDEKKGDVIIDTLDDIMSEEKEDVAYGMSIPVDEFEDLTRAKEKEVRMLPRNGELGLLSEVIGHNISNIFY